MVGPVSYGAGFFWIFCQKGSMIKVGREFYWGPSLTTQIVNR